MATLVLHGAGGFAACFPSYGFDTFEDPRCDLDGHYGVDDGEPSFIISKLGGGSLLGGVAALLINSQLLKRLRFKAEEQRQRGLDQQRAMTSGMTLGAITASPA